VERVAHQWEGSSKTTGNTMHLAIKRLSTDIIIGFTDAMSPCWGASFAKASGVHSGDYRTNVTDPLVPFRLLRPSARVFERRTTKEATRVFATNETLKEHAVHRSVADHKRRSTED
jgi:hypothetical protein